MPSNSKEAHLTPDNPPSREQPGGVPEVWAIVELMGHLTRVGRISPVKHYGAELMKIEIPVEGSFVTEEVGGSAIYRLRYVTEEVARAAAARMADPRPLNPAGYRPALPPSHAEVDDEPY